MSDILTAAETAEVMSVSHQRISQLVADGRLVPLRRDPLLFTREAITTALQQINPVGRPPTVNLPIEGSQQVVQ